MAEWGEDLGPGVVEGHGGMQQWAADLARHGGAGDAVVAVFVVSGHPSKLVGGELFCVLVVGGGLFGAGPSGKRADVEQRGGGRWAVEVAVLTDRPGMGALGAAVGGVQVYY